MRLIILPCFYPSSDGAILISPHLHSPIITCERNHQSPAGSRPSPPPPSRLQGSVSYILWTIIHTEPIKYFIFQVQKYIFYQPGKIFKSKASCAALCRAGRTVSEAERVTLGFLFQRFTSARRARRPPQAPPERRLTQPAWKFIWHGRSQARAGLL